MHCPICHSNKLSCYKNAVSSVYTETDYELWTCSDCQHIFTAPLPTAEILDDIYKNKYSYDLHLLIQQEKAYRAKKLAKYIKTLTGIQSVLEVGCMYGFLLKELQNSKLSLTGVEIDQKAVQHCQASNLNVINSSFKDFLQTSSKKYDLVIMSHSLEHVPEPEAELKNLQKLLNANGKLLIVVPNSKALTTKLTGKYWGYWQVPVHLNHFNKSSLGYLLKRTGYTALAWSFRGADSLFFLSTLANLRKTKSTEVKLGGFSQKLIRIYSSIIKYWYLLGSEDLVVLAKKN
ncbi:MAG: class I SAM-dependent methyltransferase [Candidatus Gracilibacteria bacterium]|nr:class I SAM-dependent methyltransferase [Candidatus Gracilibacteria bacterium]